jgi:hypothetical protein
LEKQGDLLDIADIGDGTNNRASFQTSLRSNHRLQG